MSVLSEEDKHGLFIDNDPEDDELLIEATEQATIDAVVNLLEHSNNLTKQEVANKLKDK
jgi:hypothetical protein